MKKEDEKRKVVELHQQRVKQKYQESGRQCWASG